MLLLAKVQCFVLCLEHHHNLFNVCSWKKQLLLFHMLGPAYNMAVFWNGKLVYDEENSEWPQVITDVHECEWN